MTFNSFGFFGFISIVFIIYGMIPRKYRWPLILVAGLCFFCFASPAGLVYLLATTATTYFATMSLNKEQNRQNPKKLKALTGATLVVNFGILFVLKYFNFFAGSIISSTGNVYNAIKFIVPLGISFYTFQSMGYLIDVYRGQIEPQESFPKLLLFLSYFPQMIDGPINRYEELSKNLYNPPDVEYERCKNALFLFAWGLFKKICIADNLKHYVDLVYENYTSYYGLIIFSGAVAYAIYIYADFSGCIDMAKGISRYFGIEMHKNFDLPYFSTSVSEFWRRWHISLSEWFKDYLFYPLLRSKPLKKISKALRNSGKKKLSKILPTSIALMIVWLTTGIWHGAKGTYILWGLYYGLFMIGSHIIETLRGKSPVSSKWYINFLKMMGTFFVVCVGYIIFNASDISSAIHMLLNMFGGIHIIDFSQILQVGISFYKQVGGTVYFAVTIVSIVILIIHDVLEYAKYDYNTKFGKMNVVVKYTTAVVVVFALLFMMNRTSGDFTYMQF